MELGPKAISVIALVLVAGYCALRRPALEFAASANELRISHKGGEDWFLFDRSDRLTRTFYVVGDFSVPRFVPSIGAERIVGHLNDAALREFETTYRKNAALCPSGFFHQNAENTFLIAQDRVVKKEIRAMKLAGQPYGYGVSLTGRWLKYKDHGPKGFVNFDFTQDRSSFFLVEKIHRNVPPSKE